MNLPSSFPFFFATLWHGKTDFVKSSGGTGYLHCYSVGHTMRNDKRKTGLEIISRLKAGPHSVFYYAQTFDTCRTLASVPAKVHLRGAKGKPCLVHNQPTFMVSVFKHCHAIHVSPWEPESNTTECVYWWQQNFFVLAAQNYNSISIQKFKMAKVATTLWDNFALHVCAFKTLIRRLCRRTWRLETHSFLNYFTHICTCPIHRAGGQQTRNARNIWTYQG